MAEHQPPEPQPEHQQPMPEKQTSSATMIGPVLVLGGTGSFGGGVARELAARGYAIKLFVRDLHRARVQFGNRANVQYIRGDVQNAEQVKQAAAGCGAIVHGVNYPYHKWSPNMTRATDNVINAANAHEATILFPGNVYGLGEQCDHPLDESAENRATTRKGRLRIELEDRLRAAAESGASRVIILRAGDYFGPTVRNGLVDPIFRNAAQGKPIRVIGRLDVPHQWAYVPDLARAAVDLLELSDQLGPFEVVHFKGHVAPSTGEFMRQVAAIAGHEKLTIRRAPWSVLRAIGVFKPVARELLELRYLFDRAVILDDAKLRRLLPDYDDTPLETAVRSTLSSVQGGPQKR